MRSYLGQKPNLNQLDQKRVKLGGTVVLTRLPSGLVSFTPGLHTLPGKPKRNNTPAPKADRRLTLFMHSLLTPVLLRLHPLGAKPCGCAPSVGPSPTQSACRPFLQTAKLGSKLLLHRFPPIDHARALHTVQARRSLGPPGKPSLCHQL